MGGRGDGCVVIIIVPTRPQKKPKSKGIAFLKYLYRIGRERRAKQVRNVMNPKSYLVLVGPTEAQEENDIAFSDVNHFSDYKTAMTYLNEEVEKQEKDERLWVRLSKYEHLHDENGRWYDDKYSVLVTVYV